MKVFVAGATGALGHALIPKLRAAGHTVVGLTRSRDAAGRLAEPGAECVVGDLLDRDSVRRVVCAAAPDVVVHAAKAIPKTAPLTYRDMRGTNRLHDDGTRHLLAAAIEAGASRFVVESIVFAYGYGDLGDATINEDHPIAASVPRPKLARWSTACSRWNARHSMPADRATSRRPCCGADSSTAPAPAPTTW